MFFFRWSSRSGFAAGRPQDGSSGGRPQDRFFRRSSLKCSYNIMWRHDHSVSRFQNAICETIVIGMDGIGKLLGALMEVLEC